MGKMNLREQINSTSYKNPSGEDFEDFIAKPVQTTFGRIVMLPIDRLVEYKDELLEQITGRPQPFRPYNKKELESLARSIEAYGVIDPITVRPAENGKYQILAGRNRTRASALCSKTEIPGIIREDIDDISAAMIMLDTNLEQRHNLRYSEKAYAYKMRTELQGKQGFRSDLSGAAQKIDTLSETGKEHKDSRRMVAYLIRLTYLIPELLSLVDNGKIGFRTGVAVSYLTRETQSFLLESVLSAGIKPETAQINELRRIENGRPLDPETIRQVIRSKQKPIPASVTISGKKLLEYADVLDGTENIERLFLEFLKQRRSSVQA